MNHKQHRNNSGFTIVELLIVIVIIAILAAITIVAYNGIQSRANDTAVKSDMNNFIKKLETFAVLKEHYPITENEMTELGLHATKGAYYTDNMNNFVYCVKNPNNNTSAKVMIGAVSKSGVPMYWYNKEGAFAKVFEGSFTNPDGSLRDMGQICADVMVDVPDTFHRGYLYDGGGWQGWTGA